MQNAIANGARVVRANRADATALVDLAAGRFGGVKTRHDRADLLKEPRLGAPRLDETVQHAIVRQPAHDDGDLAHGPLSADTHAVDTAELHDTEIHVVREATIQADLFLAEEATALEGGEVQKAEVQRLLHLVDAVAGEEDPGNVRLDQLDSFDGMRIRAGIQESGHDRGRTRALVTAGSRRSWASHRELSRSCLRSIFPAGVFGSSSRNSTSRGYSCWLSRVLTNS